MAQTISSSADRVAVAVDPAANNSLPLGAPAHLLVDYATGKLLTNAAAGGGSTDMTTTNALLTSANADLALLDTAVGNPSDTSATTDSGTFSLLALFKRSLVTLAKTGSLTMTSSSVGASSATLLAASSATKYLGVQNTHATQTLTVSTTTPATPTNGYVIPPGGLYEFPFVPSNALYVIGSGSATTYTLSYS